MKWNIKQIISNGRIGRIIDSTSYNDWTMNWFNNIVKHNNITLKPIKSNDTTELFDNSLKINDFYLTLRILEHRNQLKIPNKRGEFDRHNCDDVSFDNDVIIPILANKYLGYNVWMSLTPMEVLTQRKSIKLAKNNVLLGGLGLGWSAREILNKKSVKSLTIIDKNQDIINFFGKPLIADFGNRVKIICDNIYNIPINDYNCVLIDIWDGYTKLSKYTDNGQFFKLADKCKKLHKIFWGWGIK